MGIHVPFALSPLENTLNFFFNFVVFSYAYIYVIFLIYFI